MKWENCIVMDSSVMCGKPIIKGTCLTVEFILGLFAASLTFKQVLENYPSLD